jgi:hypothetical protein
MRPKIARNKAAPSAPGTARGWCKRFTEAYWCGVKALVSILAGIVTHSLLFAYLAGRTTCAARISSLGYEDLGKCVMRVSPDFDRISFHITWDAGDWPITFLPGYAIPAVGLVVGLILWATWARREAHPITP